MVNAFGGPTLNTFNAIELSLPYIHFPSPLSTTNWPVQFLLVSEHSIWALKTP